MHEQSKPNLNDGLFVCWFVCLSFFNVVWFIYVNVCMLFSSDMVQVQYKFVRLVAFFILVPPHLAGAGGTNGLVPLDGEGL